MSWWVPLLPGVALLTLEAACHVVAASPGFCARVPDYALALRAHARAFGRAGRRVLIAGLVGAVWTTAGAPALLQPLAVTVCALAGVGTPDWECRSPGASPWEISRLHRHAQPCFKVLVDTTETASAHRRAGAEGVHMKHRRAERACSYR